jgi:hypothetical protein
LQVFESIAAAWSNLIEAASSFMKYQRSQHHFEFFGIDVIVDEDGTCWIIEANRLPGLEASKNNLFEEDDMYDHMMTSLLNIITAPVSYAVSLMIDFELLSGLGSSPMTNLE